MPDQLAAERRPVPAVPPPDAGQADLPDQVTMPLLDRIVRESLDEDYQVVAARKSRAARGGPSAHPPPTGRPRRVAAVMMAVFGVLVAIAAVQTSRNAPEESANRASLVEQIQARRAANADLQADLERLRT